MKVIDLIDKLYHFGIDCKVIVHSYPKDDTPPGDFLSEIHSVEFDENHNQVIIELE